MKTGKSISELAAEIERRATAKKDLVVSTKDIRMHTDGALNVAGQYDFAVNGTAHQQIAEHVDIPKKYYDRMLATDKRLLATNVNHWFAANPTPRMVRTLDGNARAFLSDRYRPLENEDLATAVFPVLRDLNLAVMSCEITERRLYIKAVDKKVERELAAIGGKFGDGQHKIVRCLSPAVTISNSEIGMGALSICGGVYDSFCSNLATFGERSTRKYHVGGKHEIAGEQVFHLLSDDTRRKTDEATWAQVRDITKAAFERAHFDSLCDKIAETQGDKIEGNPVKVVELAAKKFSLTEGEMGGVMKHLIEGADLSRFGLYNAVTRTAQDLEDYDRASEFERLGATIIELPKTAWRELAIAA